MNTDELLFWDKWPELLPLYADLRERLFEAHPDIHIRASKTQISFYGRHMFAMASPPVRRRKGWPEEFMLLSFGLSHPLSSPRIAASAEPYPGRWTHHVILESVDDIDGELLDWLDEAYTFSESKR